MGIKTLVALKFSILENDDVRWKRSVEYFFRVYIASSKHLGGRILPTPFVFRWGYVKSDIA